jgi:murein L,D-transpeptidase YcbB/YkuD
MDADVATGKRALLAVGLTLFLAVIEGAAAGSGPMPLQPFLNQEQTRPVWSFRVAPSWAAPLVERRSLAEPEPFERETFERESFERERAEPVEALPDAAPPLSMSSGAPDERYITGLEQALAGYRVIAAQGGWPTIGDGEALKPGMRDPRLAAIRRRLAITGDLPRSYMSGANYDSGLELAVRRFQERHGLAGDGVVGPATIEALNTPVEARIDQISANIARWRQSAPQLGERYVLVNIPAFELEVIDDGATVMRMDVVAGRPSRPTPIFSDRIDYIEFQPYWNVPESIVRRDLVPEFVSDPSYAADNNFEVVREGEVSDAAMVDWTVYQGASVPFNIRQAPGPTNALGRVKFMLPNRHNVYLHDTPAQYLFERSERAYSSGCVRIEHPRAFAHYLLGDNADWPATRIDAALEGDQTLQVPLARPIPVHFIYMTAWVDRQGNVQFRNDVYGRDAGTAQTVQHQQAAPG